MRKIIIFIIIIPVLFSLKSDLYSMEIIIGPRIWYVSWIPWIRDAGQTAEDRYFGIQNVETGGGWMYGVSASVRITGNFNISASYLYGILGSDFEQEDRGLVFGDDIKFRQTGHADIYRHDLDVAVSYSLSNYYKIFIGYKYQPVKLDIDSSGADYNYDTTESNYNITSMNITIKNHCPAAGAGFAIPFKEKFVFNTNLSVLYLIGSSEYNHTRKYYDNADITTITRTENIKADMDSEGWGYNIEPSIVTAIMPDILFVIGFRYQMIVIDADYESEGDKISYSDMKDHVFGIFFNILYRFK